MIASIHMPKCAGTSLRKALKKLMGRDIKMDYGDKVNLATPEGLRRRRKNRDALRERINAGEFNPLVVHGHFYAPKYLGLGLDLRWVTMFREPCDLVYSYYAYLTRDRGRKGPNIERASRCGSFEEFFNIPDYQNMMSKIIYPLDIDDFELIGTLDQLPRFVTALEGLLGRGTLDLGHNNRNPEGSQYEMSPEVMRELSELNAADIALFESVSRRIHQRGS